MLSCVVSSLEGICSDLLEKDIFLLELFQCLTREKKYLFRCCKNAEKPVIFCPKLVGHRYLREVDCSRHISSKNLLKQNKSTSSGHNKGRWGDKAGRLGQAGWPIRQVGQLNRCACLNCQYFCCGHKRNYHTQQDRQSVPMSI